MSYGTVSHLDDGATVRFDRNIKAPIDRVWTALTNADDLGAWLAPTQMGTAVGQSVHIAFGDDQEVNGEITAWDPPNALEFTWTFSGEPDSVLRFELDSTPTGTRLILHHRLLPADQAAGYGAGWHAHLDSFAAVVEGTEPVEWDDRFNSVLGTYVGA